MRTDPTAGRRGQGVGMTIADRLLRLVPTALVLALPAWALSRNDEDDCRDLGACFGIALDGVLYVVVLGWPVLWLAVRLLGVPRAFLTAMVGVVLSWCTWFTALSVQHGLHPGGFGEPRDTIGLVPALLAAGVGAAVATVVVGPGRGGRRGWLLRLGLPLLLVGLGPVAAGWEHARTEQARMEEVAALPLKAYQPRIEGETAAGYRDGDVVRLHYTLHRGGGYQFVQVTLLPAAPGADLCTLVTWEVLRADCTTDGTTMRAVHDGWTEVAVVRRGTVLHADTFQGTIAGADDLLDALRTAPVVTPRELVTAGD